MRTLTPSLALLALCSNIAFAAPSPALPVQSPLQTTSLSSTSPWRILADRLVGIIWPLEKTSDPRVSATSTKELHHAPPHTTARFGGDVVLRFNISTAEEAESMAEAADTLLLDIWEFTNNWVDVRLAKDLVPSLLGLLPDSLQSSHAPLLLERELVQAIYDTYPAAPEHKRHSSPLGSTSSHHDSSFTATLRSTGDETNIFFSDYQPLSVIHPWMRLLASLFTTHVRHITIGKTYEGRDITALRVGVHPTNSAITAQRRKTIVVAGGLHAREWISTSTVNYAAYSLITAYGKNQHVTALLQEFDFVFIPTLNPDGYTYTWNVDRLWRKNRQPTGVRFCPGIDLDRGFGFQWSGATTSSTAAAVGSKNPCSEAFAGAEPFDAVEAKSFASWARNETENNNVDFVGFLDLHSYSQEILYPYSFTCSIPAPGEENLEELAYGLEKTIRVASGLIYEVMPACEGNVVSSSIPFSPSSSFQEGGNKAMRGKGGDSRLLLPRIEAAGGSALDWFYHELHVRYAYQIKLRDRGTYGFLLPRDNIVPTGLEIYDAMLYFGNFLGEVYLDAEVEEDGEVEAVEIEEVTGEVEAEEKEGETAEEMEPWILVEDLPDDLGQVEWELRRKK